MTDLTGKSLGKYKIVSRIDKGAMGEVYKGYHTSLNRNVAIKVLLPHLSAAADFIERFEREAAIVARLRHTNIMQVYDFDVVDDLYYMVMEYIDGPTLKSEMRQRHSSGRALTLFEIGYITNALASALDYAHVRGVIHRDIKPANVMFNAEGQIVLTDFGIVHIIGDGNTQETGTILGTPAYMSPEQGTGQPVNSPSDIYAFGVMLYEMLTHQLPFTGANAIDVITQHIHTPPPHPRQIRKDMPIELEQVLLKALHKDPAHRQQKAGQLAREFRHAIGMSAEQAMAYINITTIPPTSVPDMINQATMVEAEAGVTMLAPSLPGHTEFVHGAGPYRGLFAFREEDAKFFFGREEFTEQLQDLVKKQPLVAVVGSSGSGKSSVVFAGLVATLRQEGQWLIEDFRPSSHPFQALAGALVPLLHPDTPAQNRPALVEQFANALQKGERRLYEVIQQLIDSQPTGTRLLLIADQFEEMFTLCEDVAMRHRFMDELVEAIDIQKFREEQNFSLVLTLRADFLGQALAYRPFATALQSADVKLGPMSRQDLVRAIANPAKRLGVTFEPGLVMRIVGDVGDEPGNLPLLEFALSALWSLREHNQMTHDAYVQIGGVAGALARHANEVYASLTPQEQKLARRAFAQMVQPGDGTEDTRRVAVREDLTAEEWQLAQKLANERLVVTGVNEAGKETVEVVHEALIRSWGLLRQWMSEDRNYRSWQERLRSAMNQWQSSGRDEGALLRGTPLQQAMEWANRETIILSTQEQTFIQNSRDAAAHLEQEKEAQRQRELEQAKALSESRRRQIVVVRFASIGLAFLLILALCGAVFALWQRGIAQENALEAEIQATAAFVAQETAIANEHIAATRAVEAENAQATAESDRQEAENQRSLAEAARTEAETERAEAIRQGRITLAQSLVSLSVNTVNQNNDRELAALLALEANRLNNETNGNIGWYVDSALRPLIGQPYFNSTLLGHSGSVRAVTFSPDGLWLASGGADNSIRLWPLADPAAAATLLTGHTAPVLALAFSLDGSTLVSGGEDGTIRVWSLDNLTQPPVILAGHSDDILALVVTPIGQLISSSLDGTVRAWDLVNLSSDSTILLEQVRPILGMALSADGQAVVMGSDDSTVSLYDLVNNTQAVIGQHESSVIAVTFSPDQSRVASAGVDNTVRVWNLLDLESDPIVFRGHTSRVRGVIFLPDGQRIVSTGDDNTLRVWNLAQPEAAGLVLAGHELRVRALALSPEGTFMASASDDQTIRLWRTDSPLAGDRILRGHNASVLAVIYAPDGRTMFTSGADNNVRLWQTSDYTETGVLTGHTGRVRALALSPTETLLASAGDDSTIRLWAWDNSAAAATVLTGHEGAVRALLFSADGQFLYSAGDDGQILVWVVSNPTATPTVLASVEGAIFSLVFAPDEQSLVVGAGDGRILIWSLADPTTEPTILTGHTDRVNALAFAPNGQQLASASEDWTVRLWNWADLAAEPVLLAKHQAGVRSIAYAPDGSQLVSTGQDQTVLVWHPDSPTSPPTVLNGHTATVIDVAFAPNEALFATVSDDQTIRLWRPLETLVSLACQLVRRNLTPQEWGSFLADEPYQETCGG